MIYSRATVAPPCLGLRTPADLGAFAAAAGIENLDALMTFLGADGRAMNDLLDRAASLQATVTAMAAEIHDSQTHRLVTLREGRRLAGRPARGGRPQPQRLRVA